MKCTASDDAQWGGWIGIGMGMEIGVYVYAIVYGEQQQQH